MAAPFFVGVSLGAQVTGVRPTPEQAQALLQTRPDLVAQLRQRFLSSGLTRDQIHARLRAEGYPEDLLDPYLPGSTGPAPAPSDSVFRAVRALGVADSVDVATLQGGASGQLTRTQQIADSTRKLRAAIDSITHAPDSLARAVMDSGLSYFGLDVFRSSTSRFEPSLAGPVDANYRLGPGDQLVLILTGDVEAAYQLDVTREGFVVVPQVGRVDVATLTMGQLEQVLRTRLGRVYSGIQGGTTRYSISVARLRSNQVYVIGDVMRPGSYLISSAGTALTGLYAAGGPTINGSLRRVEVRREGRTVDALDVYDYLVRGDASHDVRLQTGDVLFVPVHGPRVRIVGEIARPATYEIKPGETLGDLVRDAGGFSAAASRQRVLIERIVPPGQRTGAGNDRIAIDVSSDGALDAAGSGIGLQNGDIVRVFPIAERVRNRIVVEGNVFQSGAQGLVPGMRLSDALRRAGVRPDTYLGEVLITRMRGDSSTSQLRATLADSTGAVINDIQLQEDDRVRVFSVATFRPERYVAIGGAVRNGGRYPYREGMTLRDLVLLANGLLESAYIKEAEIARLPLTRDSGRTAVTIRVPLDSTYLFERRVGVNYQGPPGFPTAAVGAPEIPLLAYDNVLIMVQPEWGLQRTVAVQGEVRFPGAYALKKKTERLSDIIQRAGGLTDEAYADGIVFVRNQNNVGRVGLDLSAALRHYESSDNLILRDGDNITIPSYNSVVTIRGAVNQPSTVAWVRGKEIEYYIDAAGGESKNGDKKHAFVAQPGGKLETTHRRFLVTYVPEPKPGSVVTVPEKDPADKKDYVAIAGAVAQILATTVAIVVALRR